MFIVQAQYEDQIFSRKKSQEMFFKRQVKVAV